MTKISVALCTYNGEKFIHQQIDSILNQTLKVDEIVVCDDGSTDKTHQILSEYQKKFPEIFKIHINEKNLRSVKNFEKAISLCTGEIIFLSDQDDIWEEVKVETFIHYFSEYPQINAICSNGTFINSDGNFIDHLSIWSVPQLLKDQKIMVDYFNIIAFIENIATGAGMAFRSSIKNNILPIPIKEGFHHDEWIALVTSYRKSFIMIDEKLFKYRIHDDQQVGGVSYNNNETTRKRLTNHFNLFSEEKTFSQYKKFLKRLSQSYYKHQALLSEKGNINTEISQEILKRSKELFDLHRKSMKKKFPFKFFVLSTADIFSKKRTIK
ncbi:glycosyltransferase family 2 protein [Chryseobacterium taiwanense]|uniref:Glycosyltransferase 2-like domain-containing protein n=1 Tax=Chryseobacterium taiwanense TaxID=363331 RepID=A0A0B4DJD8_9FLAO|nr:glycosyltransferase family 2 protein [Chryseobacterium taiwanense]KIC64540.1 hypothetical protein RM51_03080 [Chryseobacterium taiwanense]